MLRPLLAAVGAALLLAACNEPPPPPPPPPAPASAPSYMVFFDWDRSNLSQQALSTIQQAAAAFKANGSPRITAIGHTDTSGPANYNMALSLRRANAVRDALVSDGVPAGAISVIGKGEEGLLVPTADGVREPQNRRVEILMNGQVSMVGTGVFADPRSYCKALSDKYRQYPRQHLLAGRRGGRDRQVRSGQLRRGHSHAGECADRRQDPAAGAGLSLAGPADLRGNTKT